MGSLKNVGYPTKLAPRTPMRICCWCGEVFFSITGRKKYCCNECMRACVRYRRMVARRMNREPKSEIGKRFKQQYRQLDLQLFTYCAQPHLANKISAHYSSELKDTIIISRYNPDGMIAWQYYFSRNDEGKWDLTREMMIESALRDNKLFRLNKNQLRRAIELATAGYERFAASCRLRKAEGW